jgi:hypothetical protein
VEEDVTRESRYAKSRQDLDCQIVGESISLICGGVRVTRNECPEIMKPDTPF